jgi:hypothetical protein
MLCIYMLCTESSGGKQPYNETKPVKSAETTSDLLYVACVNAEFSNRENA